MKASDGTTWYNLESWNIISRIDDGAGNTDNRFGWLSDGISLTSCVGHVNDINNCYRDPGKAFSIKLPTDVNDYSSILPKNFILSQNYPNPFNPTTTINYSAPKSGFVSIKVYDVLGREVATLINENKPAGNYSIQFNSGNLVSEVYFYRMQAGDFIQTKKLILLK